MSYDLVDEQPPRPEPEKPTPKPVGPMPRLWKVEPTEEELRATKKTRKGTKAQTPRKAGDRGSSLTAAKAKSSKGTEPAATDENGEKRVLIEETPTLDTYDSRRRIRMIVGAVISACFFLVGWIVYRAFIYDSGLPANHSTTDQVDTSASLENRGSLDQEAARFMFDRAHELANNGQTDQAVAMLHQVVKVYQGTRGARDCAAALDRLDKKLPLFSDSPLVVARKEPLKAAPAPPAPPAAVVPAPPAAVVPPMSSPPPASQSQAGRMLPASPANGGVSPPTSPAQARATAPAVSHHSLPRGFRANVNAGIHESGWPFVIVGDRDGSPMVLIPGGTFSMGSNDGQPAETPAHQVRLSTYYIDQHEVTNRQFRLFLRESRYRGQPAGKWLADAKARTETEDSPVVQVNFDDAGAFALWAGKQLPTESQWEMAARSTDSRRYPWGDKPPQWYRHRAFRQIDPVMTYPEDKSTYGIFDMAGNAHEWTSDVFDSKYYQLLPRTTTENPVGPPPRGRTPRHVVRGAAKNWSVTHREGLPASVRLPYLGFRCVLGVESRGPAATTSRPLSAPSGAGPGSTTPPPSS